MEEEKKVQTEVTTPNEEQQNTAKADEGTVEVKVENTNDDINKLLQSERSKAKNEILKSLGIESVDDGKTKLSKVSEYEQKIAETEKSKADIEKAKADIAKEYADYKESVLLAKLGIPEESKADFKVLVGAKVDESHSFEEVAQEVANKYFAKPPLKNAVDTDQPKPPAKVNTFGW